MPKVTAQVSQRSSSAPLWRSVAVLPLAPPWLTHIAFRCGGRSIAAAFWTQAR